MIQNLFIFLLAVLSLCCCTGFFLAAAAGTLCSCGSSASHRSGFSCGAQALERWLNGCAAWTLLLLGTWDLPGSGIEPVSPAWAGDSLSLSNQGSLDSAIL